jgi:hypothetical protein
MPGQEIRTVAKKSFIRYGDRTVDFPFQKNIHQLPPEEFVDCLHDLYFARTPGAGPKAPEGNFKEMLYARFGRSIAEKFLIPYNEKLYACDLAALDRDAMGRFFPHAETQRHRPQHEGRRQRDLQRDLHLPRGRRHRVREGPRQRGSPERPSPSARPLVSVDLRRRVARTTKRRGPLRAPRLLGPLPEARRDVRPRPRRRRLHLEQGPRLQPRLRPQGPARRPLGVLPRPGDLVLPDRLLRQHLRHRPAEPLRRARLPPRRRGGRGPRPARASSPTSSASASPPTTSSSPSTPW